MYLSFYSTDLAINPETGKPKFQESFAQLDQGPPRKILGRQDLHSGGHINGTPKLYVQHLSQVKSPS